MAALGLLGSVTSHPSEMHSSRSQSPHGAELLQLISQALVGSHEYPAEKHALVQSLHCCDSR